MGILILIPFVALTVGLPAYLLSLLGQGSSSSVTDFQIVVGGSIVSALSSAAYVLRPTRAYGPVVGAQAVGTILYLSLLGSHATIAFPIGSATTAVANYSQLLFFLTFVPVLWLGGALLVTLSDIWHPTARLRDEFPA
ncbi:MAG: hypothetical protein ACREC5_03170 [Thermoplasmata archaeon]